MINLEDYMKAINYRISEGTEYLWKCFGDNPFTLSYWDNDHDGVSADITFDMQTQEVYYATVHDYSKKRSYRLINPDYVEAYRQECKDKNVVENNAYDEVNYVTLETDEDFIEKLTAIVNKQPYNTKVQVPLELDREEMYNLMSLAHERDITLNQLVENMLWEAIDKHKTKVNKQPYDNKVEVPLELDKEELHITLKQLAEEILWDAINTHKSKV